MRRVWRQIEGKLVEVTPGPRISEDLRFDKPFVSPVDGSVIRNKWDLMNHNAKHNIIQVLPGIRQDIDSVNKSNRNRINGRVGKQQRIEALRRAMEN